MEENKQMLELLEQIEKNSRKQVRLGRIRCLLTLVCCVIVLGTVLWLVPQVLEVLPQINTVMANLEAVTEQLASVDLAGMVTDVNSLVTTAQKSLDLSMGTLNELDMETLNKAIQDLADVVEPLAKLSNMFS